jgi:energy-coupling factor transporter ATP-binding protein EcfA2
MLNLRKLIEDTGMEILKKFDYDNRCLFVSDYKNNRNIVSRYLFVGLTSDDFVETFLDQDKYASFESDILSPFFYDVDGDLGWNLYLVCVISEYPNLNKAEVVAFEKNDKYVRKLVVDESKFTNMIPIGRVISGNKEISDIDPSNDWVESLSYYGMEFCLDDYQARKLECYINGKPVASISTDNNLNESPSNNSNELQIKKVLMNEDYRKHCYGVDSNIEFGKVNLLSGANGSGKTSLLEAIELVMTGEIRKKSKSEKNHALVEQDINSNIQLIMNDGTTMRIPTTAAKRKEQESKLYQNRTGKRDRDKLNNVFHRYNYFTFEEVFAFCYMGDQPDYKQEFSKVIFGEDIQILEKNHQKYRDEFLAKEKGFEKENIKLQESIVVINSVDQDDYNTHFDIKKLLLLLEQIDFKSIISEDITDEKILISWLDEVSLDLSSIQLLFQSLINENQKYSSIKELHDASISIKKTYNEKSDIYNNELSVIDDYNKKVDNKHKERIDLITKKNDIDNRIIKINRQLDHFKGEVLIYDEYDKSNRIIELSNIINERKIQLSLLDNFEECWSRFTDEKYIVPEDLGKLQEEEKIIQTKIIQISNQLDKQITEIELEERLNGEIESIVAEVKSLGEKYIELSNDNNICPLCGTGFDNRNDFVKAVLNICERNSDILKQKYTDKKNNEALLNKAKEDQSKIRKQYIDVEEISKAIEFVEEVIPEKIASKPILLQQKVDIINSILIYIKEQRRQLEIFNKELSILEVGIYTLDNINNAIEICNEHKQRDDKRLIKSQVDEIYGELENINKMLKVQKIQTDEQLNAINLNLTELKEMLVIKTQTVNEQKKYLELQTREITNIDNLITEVAELNDSGIMLNENDSFKILYGKIYKIISEIKETKNGLSNLQKKNKRKIEVDKINKEIEANNNYIERCAQSIKVLNTLKPSSSYADEFINNNIEDISDLFGSLHFPKEFDGLGLNDENEIVGYRNVDDKSEMVPIYLMSTGQRTAVVLSIFFKFFNSMKSIPQFILLDEPVSNIDDLNILALLDFLRELVLSKGCQVFFTTANGQVAKLFRRKFSFLRDDFYSYRFERYGNTKTTMFRDYHLVKTLQSISIIIRNIFCENNTYNKNINNIYQY